MSRVALAQGEVVEGSSLDKSSAELFEIAAKPNDPQGAQPVGEAPKRVKVGVF